MLINASAQSDILGRISDSKGQPLSYASIVLLQGADSSLVTGTVADEAGLFSLSGLSAGAYLLQASMVGYDSYQSETLPLAATDSLFLEIELLESAVDLAEVEVVAQRPFLEQKVDRTVINVENSVVSSGSDALSILERSPGIFVDRVNNQINMNGKDGIMVMLDGKMIRMDSEGLIQLLSGLSSDNIEKIELITNPSAAYDADGDAGIINIVTRSVETEGTLVNIASNFAYGIRPKMGGSFNLNHSKGKWALFTNLSASYDLTQHDVTISRQNQFDTLLSTTEIFSDRPAATGFYNYRFGADYSLTSKTTIGAIFSGYFRTWYMESDMTTDVAENGAPAFTSSNVAIERNDWIHWMANVNFRHKFKEGSSLSFDFDWLDFHEENPIDYEEDILAPDGSLLSANDFFSRKITDVDFQVAKLDYTQKISEKWSWETGLKGTLSGFTNDINLVNLEDDGGQVEDPRFTDIYVLDEKLGAAYTSFDFNPNEKLSLKAGVRYEYYFSDLTAETQGEILLQSYGRLFPTGYLTYWLNDDQQISFAYSNRISRPSIRQVAPAFIFWGYNTLLGGNPDIRPTFTNRVSASYRFKEFLLNLEFSDDRDALTYQPTIFPEENLILTRATNMPDRKMAMIGLNAPFVVADWWEMRLNASAYWFRLQPVFEGVTQTYTSQFAMATLDQNFSLPSDFTVQFVTRYFSPWRDGIGISPQQVSMNLGVKKVFSPKFSATFNWQDMFNLGSFWAINFDEPDLNVVYDWRYETEGNVFRLSLSYKFGNLKTTSSERQTGSEEERGRMN